MTKAFLSRLCEHLHYVSEELTLIVEETYKFCVCVSEIDQTIAAVVSTEMRSNYGVIKFVNTYNYTINCL